MTKFLNKFKKPCFWTIFGPFSQFLEQKNFFWKIRTTVYGFQAPCQNLGKTNDKKRPDRWKDRWKDGQTLFYMTLQATTGSPIRII